MYSVSLCQCLSVCRRWRQLANDALLWRRLCSRPKWRLSQAAEQKQLLRFLLPDGSTNVSQCLIYIFLCLFSHPMWVPGLRIDPLHLLAGCRKRRLNQAPLSLRGLIWLLMMDWSERGNIKIAALVIIAQCNTLVAWCSRQLIGPADLVFVTLGPLRCD